jgi:hypothetical protein
MKACEPLRVLGRRVNLFAHEYWHESESSDYSPHADRPRIYLESVVPYSHLRNFHERNFFILLFSQIVISSQGLFRTPRDILCIS